jgi:uncharacterized protein (TIRG00374 family)
MSERIWSKSLLLTAILVAIISAVSVWLAWNSAADLAQRLSIVTLVPIASAALVSYTLRILRFHYFLKRSGVAISLRGTAVVQAIGFALSVTPGHIGEVFKLHLIRERAGTPVIRTAPLLLLDRITEGGGFLLLAVFSAIEVPNLRAQVPTPTLILFGLGAILAFALAQHYWGHAIIWSLRTSRSTILRRGIPHLRNLWRGLQSSFTVRQMVGGIALSTVARLADGFVVLFAAHLLGVELPLPAAVLVLAVSGLAGGISLLPAGTGAVETTMVGLLVVLGATLPAALAITLLARLSTLWLWVALGLAVAFVMRFSSGKAPTTHPSMPNAKV